jgi:hypothetical protein
MVTEIGNVGTGLVQGLDNFISGNVGGATEVGNSSLAAAQQPNTADNVQVGAVSDLFVALSDVKDAAAKTSKSVQEAAQALLGNAQTTSNNVSTDATKTDGNTQLAHNIQEKKQELISEEQAAYLAKLNIGRVALQAQLDRLSGLLDINLQQLTTESDAQVVGHTAAGQLAIVLQPLGRSSAFAALGQ